GFNYQVSIGPRPFEPLRGAKQRDRGATSRFEGRNGYCPALRPLKQKHIESISLFCEANIPTLHALRRRPDPGPRAENPFPVHVKPPAKRMQPVELDLGDAAI